MIGGIQTIFLLLIDDQEEYKRLLEIVQKDSRFQDFITEMKNGGMIKKFKNGGAVYNYQNSYKKDLPVGNSDTPKGVIYIEDLIPIQAESMRRLSQSSRCR